MPERETEKERAILAGFRAQGTAPGDDEDPYIELERLADTSGAEVVATVTQGETRPTPQFLIGRGKVDELAESVEEHEAIKRVLEGRPERPTPAKPPSGGQTVYTLKIEGPVGKIASGLATELGLQIEFDQGATDKLNELVSLDVKEVSLEGLLDALFSPAGLSYELTGKSLRVLPRGAP